MLEHSLLEKLENIQDELATEMLENESTGLVRIHASLEGLMVDIADEGIT